MQIKIGTGWVYNTITKRGSRVIRTQDGNVDGYKKAFRVEISYADESIEYIKDVGYNARVIEEAGEKVPFGVIQQAIEMQILEDKGKLEELRQAR